MTTIASHKKTSNKGSPLGLLDGIIGGLCRGDPAKTKTSALVSKEFASLYGLLKSHGGMARSLLSAKVTPNYVSDLVQITFPSPDASHALYLARAGLEALYDAMGSKIYTCDSQSQLSAFRRMVSWPIEDFVANAKYWISYPMASYLHNVPPKAPPKSFCSSLLGRGSSLLYSGAIKRFLKSRLVSYSSVNSRLFLTLLQGVKRGAQVVPASFIHQTMLKHKSTLTKSRPASWFSLGELDPYVTRFYRRLRPVEPELMEPTQSASYEATRSSGGAREFLRKELQGSTSIFSPPSDELLEMYEERPGVIREVRGVPAPRYGEVLSSVISRGVVHQGFFNLDDSTLALNQKISAALSSLGLTSRESIKPPLENKVMVSGVLEPLKVRLITKGESWKYWLSRFYQKYLWHDLQRVPAFVATGRPIGTDDFYDLLERERSLGLDFEDWVSGDYSAATDNLKIDYTKLAFEASLERSGLSSEEKILLRGVLYEQELHYPLKEGIPPACQETGQLMGSTLSFPILCSMNLICYWYALEHYLGRRVPISQLPVLVNGDDILFRCDGPGGKFYRLWLNIITEVGFELSLGKNYVHRRFFTINSEGFDYNPETGRISEVPFLNVGLLLGQSKVTSRKEASLKPIWDLYNEVLAGALNKPHAHRRFMHYHHSDIKTLTDSGKYSLFLDPLFGGLGFKLYPEVVESKSISKKGEIYFTTFQRRFGGFLKSWTCQPFEGEFKPSTLWRGLVSFGQPKVTMRHRFHHGRYHLIDKMCPLQRNQVLAYDPSSTIASALLSCSLVPDERPVLKVHPPDRKVFRAFSERERLHSNPEVRPQQLYTFHSVWVEDLIDPLLPL